MNDELKAAKAKLDARKRIKAMEKELKLEKAYAKYGIEPSHVVIARRKAEFEKEYAAVPLETKQKFLDHMAQGLNVGQARELVGVSLDVAAQIVLRNYDTIELFPRKAKV